MSHLLDLDSTYEKLILLQHFVYGSEQYCRKQLTGSIRDIGNEALDAYWSWAKSIVSSYTLECCIRLRVLLDTLKGKPEAKKITKLDAAARSGLVIGQVIEGNFRLTLRETYNKVIHARKVVPEWATGMEGDVEFKYWNGDLNLSGTKGNEKWQLLLHISQWARSVELFLDEAESAQLTSYVGQDWY